MKHQGAKAAKRAVRGHDLYETHAEATRTIMSVEPLVSARPLSSPIWEPCAGRGAIIRELKARGHSVVAQDLVAWPDADEGIEPGIDFLMETRARSDLIVTNPPYMLANEFIRHGLGLGCTMIVFLRLMAIEGQRRSDLNDHHLVTVWAGKERLPMMHRYGYTGKKIKGGGVPYAWFVYAPEPLQLGQATALRRMSWRTAT